MQEDKMVVWGGFTNNRKGEKWKAREKRKDIPIWLQSSKEQQQEIRSFLKWTMQKKKKKKIEENNRMGKILDISSRKLQIGIREYFTERWAH